MKHLLLCPLEKAEKFALCCVTLCLRGKHCTVSLWKPARTAKQYKFTIPITPPYHNTVETFACFQEAVAIDDRIMKAMQYVEQETKFDRSKKGKKHFLSTIKIHDVSPWFETNYIYYFCTDNWQWATFHFILKSSLSTQKLEEFLAKTWNSYLISSYLIYLISKDTRIMRIVFSIYVSCWLDYCRQFCVVGIPRIMYTIFVAKFHPMYIYFHRHSVKCVSHTR